MKHQHNIDGIYFRVKRDNKYENICFSDLTEEEMYEVMKNWDRPAIERLAVMLGQRLYEVAEQFEIYAGDEE